MTNDPEASPAAGPSIPAENLPDDIRPVAADLNAFLREVPRLLREGE